MPRRRTRGGDTVPAGYERAVEQTPDSGEEEESGDETETGSGGVDDLFADQTGGVQQQVASAANADLRIADQFNPGFTETEVINRLASVISLNLNWDPTRGEWVADPVDQTERQAVEQTLAEDAATGDLGDVVEPSPGTTVDDDGNLRLSDEFSDTDEWGSSSATETSIADGRSGIRFEVTEQTDGITAKVASTSPAPQQAGLVRPNAEGGTIDVPFSGGQVSFSETLYPGSRYSLTVGGFSGDYQAVEYTDRPTPFTTGPFRVTNGLLDQRNTSNVCMFSQIGSGSASDTGTATTSFDNPCRTSSTKSAQYNVCSRSSDVQVDLWHRTPHGPDSTLLARDIDEREDLSDIPNSYGNLQYELTLTRAPDGSSPKVERLGHQYIR